MKKNIPLAFLVLFSVESQSAGFDCGKASTAVEKLICQNPVISELDSRMAQSYEQALAGGNGSVLVKEQQRRWLREVRNRCSDASCLEAAYLRRLGELSSAETGMTNEKEGVICEAIVDAVNNGSIAQRIVSFGKANEEDVRAWNENQPAFSMLRLYQTLKITAYGKSTTLGLVQGGGTCGNCDIEDIYAPVSAVYPEDDAEEHFRGKGWGQCDHFLFVDGEPIIVTGNFHWGQSRATFVTWLAPDGAKRALCLLGPDSGNKPTRKLVANHDPKLCEAVSRGRVEVIPWKKTLDIPNESTGNDATMWDSSRDVEIDINRDGKKENVVLFDHASMAGCGSYYQWLREFSTGQRSVFPEEPQSGAETQLNQALWGIGGPIKNAREGDDWYTVQLFRYAGKPYILAQGAEVGAAVVSVWGNQKKTWCEYQVIPQHKVETYYPVETWPALHIPKLRKIKGGQALHNAASRNDLKKALELIENGTPVDAADDSGDTALWEAVSNGHAEMAKLLLDKGASVDGVRGWRGSPLMSATSSNNVELVRLLLERRADPNVRADARPEVPGDRGSTALGIARGLESHFGRNPESPEAKKNKQIIEMLMGAGAKN